jgi:hypothetical protein
MLNNTVYGFSAFASTLPRFQEIWEAHPENILVPKRFESLDTVDTWIPGLKQHYYQDF